MVPDTIKYDAADINDNIDTLFIQYMARIWHWYSLRGLHICITWFSLYDIYITRFSLI